MAQIDKIKEMICGMMAQEMENFKEAVSNGEGDETASPVVYTMLQVLLAKIEQMPKVWHDVNEKPDDSKRVVVCTNGRTVWMAMTYDLLGVKRWAYVDELIPEDVIIKE